MKMQSKNLARVLFSWPKTRAYCSVLTALLLVVISSGLAAAAATTAAPTAATEAVLPLAAVDHYLAPTVDVEAERLEDEYREDQGLPPRFAIPYPVSITPVTGGTWEELPGNRLLWRLRITSPHALSLNLGFTRYTMPKGGSLFIYDTELKQTAYRYTDADNETHGELWTPVVLADDIMVELTIPVKARKEVVLRLTSINVGYRGFGEIVDKSGACNNDVVCPEGDPWRDDIQSVGVISTGGSTFCTGFMVNNTAEDETPYFMTANHCGISSGNAASLVVYWNFQSPNCGDQCCGSLADNQTGSYFRSSYSSSDFTLVELDSPPNPDHNVSFAGWDRTSNDATSAVAIHHPNTDEKAISFEYDPCTTTSYLGTSIPGDGTHVRVEDWDDGTTEPGSSGSPLFDQNHRVVGQLHGGYASCTSQTSDWYGRFSVSWTGGGTSSSRLSNWLDPISSGATTVDLLAPGATGLRVTPSSSLISSGDVGGPFTPSSQNYTLENAGETGFNYSVTKSAAWVSLTNTSGYLPPAGTVVVTVSINSNANGLTTGTYNDTVIFTNTTTGEGDTSRNVSLQVGVPSLVYFFPLDTDPGWATQGQWAFGQPTGSGGEYGGPDPTSGYTGNNVYGYNLNGDYANNLSETHLTASPIDCSSLSAVTLKFRRWLGVETPTYDHAYVRVSNDNINWTTVWQNGGYIEDSSWQFVEYDISAVADGQETVYVRWTIGTTDSSWRYCGWNIDDVEIWGLEEDILSGTPDGTPSARTALHTNVPNPFNPMTQISFELERATSAQLAIYDLRGRLVRQLLNGTLPAGAHSVTWDGKDATGHAVSSGTYLYRLRTKDMKLEQKMLLVR